MKVVHLVPEMTEGGVESVVCRLNRALVKAGWQSTVISRGGGLVERIEREGGRHVALDLKSKNPFTYFMRAARLRRALEQEKPDVVCAHSRVPAWLFVRANRTLRLPWITYAHGANSVSRYSEVMTKGDLVVTPSAFLADYLKRSYAFDAGKIRVIPPIVDAARFDPEKLDGGFIEEKRKAWGLAPDAFVTLSLGRITPLKGFDNVIRDFARTGRPDAKLVIVGGADAGKENVLAELRGLAESLGIGDRVVFAGSQTKIPECLSIASEVVSGNMTKPESFGLAVAEALAMNRPVRLLRVFGGTAEILEDVAAFGAATPREAVLALYGEERCVQKTVAAYEEAGRRAQ